MCGTEAILDSEANALGFETAVLGPEAAVRGNKLVVLDYKTNFLGEMQRLFWMST